MINDCYFTPSLLGVAESWRLASWCVEHGANELSVRVRCAEGEGTRADEFEDVFEPWSRGAELRRVVVTTGEDPASVVRLWRLDEQSLLSLRRFMPDGLFTHRVDPRGWLEDPVLFRERALMLGVVTHEREGVLRVTAEELRELQRVGFDFADSGTSIRF